MGRLNKMMGDGVQHAESFGKLEKKKSWEDIPILIGGSNFLTPDERMQKEEAELAQKLKQEEEEAEKNKKEEGDKKATPRDGSIPVVVEEEIE